MDNITINEGYIKKYYLYIDDSCKFYNQKDDHVIYSYVLLDKEKRDEFNEKYIESMKNIRMLGKHIENKKYDKNDLSLWYSWIDEKYKANDIFSKYKTAINKKNKKNIDKYEKLFSIFNNNCIDFGSVSWCKKGEDSTKFIQVNSDRALNDLQKKKFMIISIVKKIIDDNLLESNAFLKIYLDVETDDNIDLELKASIIENYLMQIPNPPYFYINKMLYARYAKKINISVEYLESDKSFPIQFADILANATNKILNKNLDLELFFPYFKNYSINFLVKSLFSFDVIDMSSSNNIKKCNSC
ncbi:DUF3800 domain-containing protein [Spiroplasma endosymbiont of Cantharis lateralis]|uniref:DUF3800 domain-containing protein n=1 Tax=Spiroplasma endosymbiont of Cantharis lateralis TaxID=3066277 RepID=UPI00313E9234